MPDLTRPNLTSENGWDDVYQIMQRDNLRLCVIVVAGKLAFVLVTAQGQWKVWGASLREVFDRYERGEQGV